MKAEKYFHYFIVPGLAILFLIFFSDYIAWEIGLEVANITYGEKILTSIYALTVLVVFWYAWETRRMKNEMVTQTELKLKPILVLYIRTLKKPKDQDYCVETVERTGEFILQVRNVGRGPAANLLVENNDFEVEKYQSNFLAPEGDEQSFKIKRKDNKAIQSYRQLNGVEFTVSAGNYAEPQNRYFYIYEIVNLEKQEVRFVR
ncbi:MAG: hypothetical protein ABH826_04850 [Patescibacteria group bacterium]